MASGAQLPTQSQMEDNVRQVSKVTSVLYTITLMFRQAPADCK